MQPQQYPPQPQYAPQGYPPQPQYAAPAPAYQPPPAQAPAPTGANPFINPNTPGGGGAAPRARDMQGCIVAYSPKKFTAAGTEDNLTGVGKDAPNDRVTTDIFVLDTNGAPIQFGGSPDWDQRPTPHTHFVVGPARFSGVWVSNRNIVQALAPGGVPQVGALILGRIERSTVGNKPFNLASLAEDPAGMAKAISIWNALTMNQMQYNEPQPIPGVVPAAPPANSVQYVAPVQPAAQPVQQYAPAPVQPQYQAYQQPAPAPVGPPPPHGWTEAGWATLNDAQKAQVLAQFAQPVQAPAPQYAPQGAPTPNPF